MTMIIVGKIFEVSFILSRMTGLYFTSTKFLSILRAASAEGTSQIGLTQFEKPQ